jgi:transposase
VYEGNRHDAKIFATVLHQFFEAFKKQRPNREGITIVFDKGNNSADNLQKFVEDSGYHFVESVKPCEHKELATIPNTDGRLKKLDEPRLEEVKAFRCKKKIYGKDMTVIVAFNNHLYTSQLMTLNVGINKGCSWSYIKSVGIKTN